MSNRLPLTSTYFQNTQNPLHSPSQDNFVKPENFLDGQPAETTTSFLDVEPSPNDTATRASNSRSDTPIKSSTTIQCESTIQRKTIRKLRDSSDFKSTQASNSSQTRRTQGSAYKTLSTKRKFVEDYSSGKTSAFEEKETTASSPSPSHGHVVTVEDFKPKTVCFLNKLETTEKKIDFSGLNVIIESDEEAFAFRKGQETTTYIVE